MNREGATIRLAIVDSDSGFLKVLTNRLEGGAYEFRILSGGVPPDELIAMRLNAILIDPAALRSDPWQFLDRVCNTLPGLGVVVCTAGSTVAQRVRGLRLGADDWITKPSHPEEVLARVEAVVRRHHRGRATADAGPLVVGELEIRPDQFQAFVAGQSVGLTRREFELLAMLAEAQGRVIERDLIYHSVWGYEMAHGDRSVDVFVRKLRAKLERHSAGWAYIHTHFGIGYRFEPESRAAHAEPAPPVEEQAPDPPFPGASQPFHTRATAR